MMQVRGLSRHLELKELARKKEEEKEEREKKYVAPSLGCFVLQMYLAYTYIHAYIHVNIGHDVSNC